MAAAAAPRSPSPSAAPTASTAATTLPFAVGFAVGFAAFAVGFVVGFVVGFFVGAFVGGDGLTLRHVPPTSVPKGLPTRVWQANVGHLAVVSLYCEALQWMGAVFFVVSEQPAAVRYELVTFQVPGTSGKGGLPVVELVSPV